MNHAYSSMLDRLLAADSTEGIVARITLILAVAWLAHGALQRSNPRWRVLAWRLAMAGMLIVPIAAFFVPRISFDVLPAESRSTSETVSSPNTFAVIPAEIRNDVSVLLPMTKGDAETEATPFVPPSPTNSDEPVPTRKWDWTRLALIAWIIGVAISLVSDAFAWKQLRALRRRSESVSPELTELGSAIASRLGCRRTFQIRRTSELSSPCVFGVLHPVVFLPRQDCQPERSEELPGILSHEIAHLAGNDLVWNEVIRLCTKLIWFHPLMWKVRSAHLSACDAVCDATAAGYLGDVAGYGRLLAQMALRLTAADTRVALQMARPSTVRQRIEALHRRLYSSPLSRTVVIPLMIAGFVTAGICGAVSIAREQVALPAGAKAQSGDLRGDALPDGAIARFGSIRYTHGERWNDVAMLPDSATVVTHPQRENGGLHFWDARTGLGTRKLEMQNLYCEAFALSPDGKSIAVAGSVEKPRESVPEIRILNTESGEVIRTLKRTHRQIQPALLFTPDGEQIVSISGEGVLRVEKISDGRETLSRNIASPHARSLTISPDGSRIAVQAGYPSRILLVDRRGGEPRELNFVGEPREGRTAFSPDGRHLAWAGWGADPLYVWNVDDGTIAVRLEVPQAGHFFRGAVAFSPDGKRLFATESARGKHGESERSQVSVWDAGRWKHERTIDVEMGNFLISPDGKLLVCGSHAFDLEKKQKLAADDRHRRYVCDLVGFDNGLVASADDTGLICIWEDATGRLRHKFRHENMVKSIAVSPDAKRLVSSSVDDTVRLWDLTTGKQIYRLPGNGRLGGLRAVAFGDAGRRIHAFGDDAYLRVFDANNGKVLNEVRIRPAGVPVPADDEDPVGESSEFFHYVREMEFSLGGERMAIGVGTRIEIYDGYAGRLTNTLDYKGKAVSSFAFSPDATRLLACDSGVPIETPLADGSVRHESGSTQTMTIWNLADDKVETETRLEAKPIRYCRFTPDGKGYATVSFGDRSCITTYGLDGRRIAELPATDSEVYRFAFASDGRSLITTHFDFSILVWKPEALVAVPR